MGQAKNRKAEINALKATKQPKVLQCSEFLLKTIEQVTNQMQKQSDWNTGYAASPFAVEAMKSFIARSFVPGSDKQQKMFIQELLEYKQFSEEALATRFNLDLDKFRSFDCDSEIEKLPGHVQFRVGVIDLMVSCAMQHTGQITIKKIYL